MNLLRYIWLCYTAYKGVQKTGAHYAYWDNNGVPDMVIFVGIGRKAWQITNVALNCKE